MSIRINNITLKLDEPMELLKKKVSKKLKIDKEEIKEFKILNKILTSKIKGVILSRALLLDTIKSTKQQRHTDSLCAVVVSNKTSRVRLIFPHPLRKH